jgi:hypothetical protein
MATTDFSAFMGDALSAGRLESSAHNRLHNSFGSGSIMGTFRSPMDPIFYLHHANVDRIWAEWQQRNPKWNSITTLQTEFPDWLAIPETPPFYGTNGRALTVRTHAANEINFAARYQYDTTQTVIAARVPAAGGRSIASVRGPEKIKARGRCKASQAKPKLNSTGTKLFMRAEFDGETLNAMNDDLRDPYNSDDTRIRFYVSGLPKFPKPTSIKISLGLGIDPDAREDVFEIITYSSFEPDATDLKMMGEEAHHHHGGSVYNPFHVDFKLILWDMFQSGIRTFPKPASMILEFGDEDTQEPASASHLDFRQLAFEIRIAE